MRAVMIMFDTLSKDFLPNYGNHWVEAPNFERLREKCTTFDQFYGGSMPCMPARRELHTGKYNFLHRGWGPLESFDGSIFEKLQAHGIYTHLVTDHSHYFEDGGATYHNRYSTWEGFRGQEGDRYVPRSQASANQNEHPLNKKGISVTQHYANRTRQVKEEEMPTVRTIQAGLDFLTQHHDKEDWFLQIECFDPHEPFYVPEKYRAIYTDKASEEVPYWPAYQHLDDTPEGIDDLRLEYAALVSMCDTQLGKILDFFDTHKMWDDTLIIINTDHGFLLGEHDWLGKNFTPMYEEVIHLPFFIHVPDQTIPEERVEALCQTIDIPPTLLDYFKVPDSLPRDGKSLLPMLKEQQKQHETILFGTNGGQVNIFDGRYLYMRSSTYPDNQPLASYTLSTAQMRGFIKQEALDQIELTAGTRFTNGAPVLRIPMENHFDTYPFGHLLFDMKQDPQQAHPISDNALEKTMCRKLIAAMQKVDAPPEEFVRLGLAE